MFEEIKQCIFCGNSNQELLPIRQNYMARNEPQYHVDCDKCNVRGPLCETAVEAVEIWNKTSELYEFKLKTENEIKKHIAYYSAEEEGTKGGFYFREYMRANRQAWMAHATELGIDLEK